MRKMIVILMMFAATVTLSAQEATVDKGNKALKKGAEFLLEMQNEDGSFGTKPSPAIAALAAIALKDTAIDPIKRQAAIDKAMAFVLSYVKEDGSFRAKAGRHFVFFSDAGYPTYTTAVSLLAMDENYKPEYLEKMQAAREYLKTSQIEDENSPHFGGYNYGTGGKADMSNTSWAAEALFVTEKLERETFTKKGKTNTARSSFARNNQFLIYSDFSWFIGEWHPSLYS